MNNKLKAVLHSSAMCFALLGASLCHADLNRVMSLINDPTQAPIVRRCQNKVECNAFVAISKEWQIIPKDDPLRYFIYSNDLQGLRREGQGKNLKSQKLKEIEEYAAYIFEQTADNPNDYWMYLKGLVVLQYIERTQFNSQ